MPGILGDEEKEEQAAERPRGLPEGDGEMLHEGALEQRGAQAAGTPEQMTGDEAAEQNHAGREVTGPVHRVKRGNDEREESVPAPEEQSRCRRLERDEQRLYAANPVGDHEWENVPREWGGTPGRGRG